MSRLFHTPPLRRLTLLLASLLLLSGYGARQATASTKARPNPAPAVHLPADQAAHNNVNNEWWYVVGHLRAGARTFGYEVSTMKFYRVRPPGFRTPLNLYRTDIAITDEAGHRFYHRITPYFPQSASVSTRTLSVSVGTASLQGASPKHMVLAASIPAGSLRLDLSSRRPPMYVGGSGYLPFGSGYTYYYSLTDLATSGTLRFQGKTYRTSGISWLDHQWGDWSWGSISGWTWMCLQLSNGVQLSAFDFRGYGRRTRAASVLLANGTLRTIPQLSITPQGTWHSPHTQGTYPGGALLRIPALGATLRVRPTVADQELVLQQERRGSYWEGSSRVSGTYGGKPVSGVAYLELTGYARR